MQVSDIAAMVRKSVGFLKGGEIHVELMRKGGRWMRWERVSKGSSSMLSSALTVSQANRHAPSAQCDSPKSGVFTTSQLAAMQ